MSRPLTRPMSLVLRRPMSLVLRRPLSLVLRRRRGRPLLAASLALVALLLSAAPAAAHPLGNFSVNSFSALRVEPGSVAVRVIVDSAEIPTIQTFPDVNTPAGVPPAAADGYADRECARLLPGLALTVAGAAAALSVESSRLQVLPGDGGLHTMRLTCDLGTAGSLDTVGHTVTYVDRNSLGRTGWREIIAVGDGVALAASSVPTESVSEQLTDYPRDLLESPLDQRRATLRAVPGEGTGGEAQSPALRQDDAQSRVGGLASSFTQLVSERELGVGFVVLALLVAVALGAAHAFAPGHGKTLMAAYLMGQHSSLRQVGLIGLTVTLTHTAGVLVLGMVLSAVAITAPAGIYSWLGLAAGVLLMGIGANLFRHSRHRPTSSPIHTHAPDLVPVAAEWPHPHPHDPVVHHHTHDHPHDHGGTGTTHGHGWGQTHTHPPPASTARGMIAVGFAGGMVPSPSALIVLLGGIALGRAWFGVVLVLAYGLGMALALTGTGLALARARDLLERRAQRRRHIRGEPGLLLRLMGVLPSLTAALVVVVGAGLALRSVLTL